MEALESNWDNASQWYKSGYSEGYNWRMTRYGAPEWCVPDVPQPQHSDDVRQSLSDYMIGQTLGEIDASTIYWAKIDT